MLLSLYESVSRCSPERINRMSKAKLYSSRVDYQNETETWVVGDLSMFD